MDEERDEGTMTRAVSGVGPTANTAATTTISTIAVQSGNTRIVIALLQSKEWMQLKVQEMQPPMTDIGSSLEEAITLHQQHEQVLEKLQTKQSPVEELLRQADELISTQQPRAEVYAAMAENLGLAWKDLNNQLEQRRQILEQAVTFYSRTRDFAERIDKSLSFYSDNYLPSDTESCKVLLQRIHDDRKSILELSLQTLNSGQYLAHLLNEIATGNLNDSRPEHMKFAAERSSAQVQRLIENLHDRWRYIDSIWHDRKGKLEQILQICLVCSDLDQVENWLQTKGLEYMRRNNLGDSSASAEILLHEHNKVEMETKEVQDRSIRLLKTIEQLPSSGLGLADTAKWRAYQHLSDCSELFSAVHTRYQLLSLAIAFFNLSQTVSTKLDQLEVQLSTSDLSPNSANQIKQAINELVNAAIPEGQNLVEMAGNNGTEGVQRKIAELEARRQTLLQLCSSLESKESNTAFINFHNKYDSLHTWIINTVQAFLQGHQDMGTTHPMAKNFLESHEILQKELRVKGVEVDALLKVVPSLVRIGGKEAEEVHQKADDLRNQWSLLIASLDSRILIAQRYANFHKLAAQLSSDMDAIDSEIQANRENVDLKKLEEKWISIQQQYLELNHKGKNYIEDAHKVNDPYLDIKRSIVCVQTILDQLETRKMNIENLWNNWQRDVTIQKERKMQWEYYAKEVQRVVEVVTSFRLHLYPIIPQELNRIESILVFLERHQENLNAQIKSIGKEIEDCLSRADQALTKEEPQYQREQLVTQMKSAQKELESKLSECFLLVSTMITFFRNLQQLEERHKRHDTIADDAQSIDQRLIEHETHRTTFLELLEFANREADQLAAKIDEIEPTPAAEQDKEKLRWTFQCLHQQLENDWRTKKEWLEQQKFYKQLREINQQIQELSDQLASMKGNAGESLSTVKLTSQAFVQLQKTIELLDQKVNTFVSTAQRMVTPPMKEIKELKTKWSSFHMQIGDTRRHVDLVLEYFTLIEKIEEWLKEGSQLLISIARKSTGCKSPNEATQLQREVDVFLKHEAQQQNRLKKLSTLSIQLYGGSPPIATDNVSQKNKEIMTSFASINRELENLKDNLAEAEKEKQRSEREPVREVKAEPPQPEVKAPTFTVPLMDFEVTEGSKVTFLCHVDGVPTPYIEWLKDGILVQNNPDYQTKYENGLCTLTIEETFAEDSARYVCRATNAAGRAETQGQLIVRESHPHEETIPPHFIQELVPMTVRQGQPCQLECHVIGSPLPLVSWFKNDVCIDSLPEYVITCNNGRCVLRLEEAYLDDDARYTCRAANVAGQVACSAKLTVSPAEAFEEPQFTMPLSNVMARAGQKLRLECKVKGTPTPTIEWYHNRQPVSDFCQTQFDDDTASLVIPEAFPKDAGTYTAVAKNEAGEATSSCLVSVKGRLPLETSDSEMTSDLELLKPFVRCHLEPQTVTVGNPVRLDCVIVGQPEPEVIWYHDGKPVKESENVQLLFEGDRCTLIVQKASMDDVGEYRCVAINSAGETSSTCYLTVRSVEKMEIPITVKEKVSPPTFLIMLRNTSATEGESIKMVCRVAGDPFPSIAWYKDGHLLQPTARYEIAMEPAGVTSLTIPQTQHLDSGEYTVTATNDRGEAKCVASLNIIAKPVPLGVPPKFSKYLEGLTAYKEDEATFQCTVTGTPKPEVKWYFQDKLIKGDKFQQITADGDNHSLKIVKCLPYHSGVYSVKAENETGRAVSTATLNVIEHEQPVPSPSLKEHRVQSMVMSKRTRIVQRSTICQPIEFYQRGSFEIYTTDEEMEEEKKPAITYPNAVPETETGKAPPKFAKPLHSLTIKSGQRLQFEVEVTGQPVPEVTWYRNRIQLKDSPDFRITSSGNVYQLLIPEVFPDDSGSFQVTATNPYGEATSSAELVVEEEINGTQQRVSIVEEKKELFTKISMKKTEVEDVEPIPEVKIWTGPKPVPHPAPLLVTLIQDIPTEVVREEHRVEKTVEICPKPIIKKEEGKKRVAKPKKEVCIEEEPVVGTKVHPPVFSKALVDVTVDQGAKVVLQCHVEGSPAPTIKWFRDHQQIASSKDFETFYKDGVCSLTIPEAYSQDQGKYTCTATNIAGTKSTSAKLTVIAKGGEIIFPWVTRFWKQVFICKLHVEKMSGKSYEILI